jgi:hypothetical protein
VLLELPSVTTHDDDDDLLNIICLVMSMQRKNDVLKSASMFVLLEAEQVSF